MRKKNCLDEGVQVESDVSVPIHEKKTRERKEKYPGCTAVYIDTASYAWLAKKPRTQIEEIGVDIPANKMETFVIKKVSELVMAAVAEKYPGCKGGD